MLWIISINYLVLEQSTKQLNQSLAWLLSVIITDHHIWCLQFPRMKLGRKKISIPVNRLWGTCPWGFRHTFGAWRHQDLERRRWSHTEKETVM
jgi:hypothetical protein